MGRVWGIEFSDVTRWYGGELDESWGGSVNCSRGRIGRVCGLTFLDATRWGEFIEDWSDCVYCSRGGTLVPRAESTEALCGGDGSLLISSPKNDPALPSVYDLFRGKLDPPITWSVCDGVERRGRNIYLSTSRYIHISNMILL